MPETADFDSGVLGWLRRGLQSNPMTGAAARTAEALVRPDEVRKPQTAPKVASTGGFERVTKGDTGGFERVTGGFSRIEKPFENDAGQMVLPSGKEVTPPKPTQEYEGQVLPLRRDENGKLHFSVPEAVNPLAIARNIGEGAAQAGRDLLGAGAAPGSAAAPSTTGAMMALAASGLPGVSTAMSPASRGFSPAPSRDFGRTGLPQGLPQYSPAINKAVSKLGDVFDTGVKGGAPTAMDTMTELNRAHAAGQPMTLLDVPNAPVEKLARDIYRRGGEGAATIGSFLEKRKAGQIANTEQLINRSLSDKPLAATFKQMRETRKANGDPLFEDVKRGASTAPLAEYFQKAWDDSVQAKEAALVRVKAARQELAQAGDTPAAAAAAQRKLDAAMADLEKTANASNDLKARLERSLKDGTGNAPGAVWSPRLQEMLNRPRVREGIRRGVEMMRDEAAGEGRPVNLSEYAIKGLDKRGEPILGEVPNMSLLMIAKEGLDRILQSDKMHEKFGGYNKEGKSVLALRNGMVDEMTRLSPKYKEALDEWAGDSQVMEATRLGGKLFSKSAFPTVEEAGEYIGSLPASAREGFIMGVAQELKNTLFRGGRLHTEDMKRRIRPLFKTDAEANDFIDALGRHQTMNETHRRMTGWRQIPDDSMASEIAVTAAHGLLNVIRGHTLGVLHNVARASRMMGSRSNPAVDAEIARTLTNPNVRQMRALPASKIGDRGPMGGTLTNVQSYKATAPQ